MFPPKRRHTHTQKRHTYYDGAHQLHPGGQNTPVVRTAAPLNISPPKHTFPTQASTYSHTYYDGIHQLDPGGQSRPTDGTAALCLSICDAVLLHVFLIIQRNLVRVAVVPLC